MRNNSGWTPLMYAAHYGHYNVIRVLLQHGANNSLQEPNNGKTALMLAASNGHTRCIEMLVCQGGADITQRDFSGNSASFYATHYGHGSNKIIARLLAIRHLPSTPTGSISLPGVSSPTSGCSTLQHSNNTSGYKSASGHGSSLNHSPSSPLSTFDSHSPVSNAESSSPGIASGRNCNRSPKNVPRAIFKSPIAYSQHGLSNENCSSLSSAMPTSTLSPSGKAIESISSDYGTDHLADAFLSAQRSSLKSPSTPGRDDLKTNVKEQLMMEHSAIDQHLSSLQFINSSPVLNHQSPPLCSTPQSSTDGGEHQPNCSSVAQFSLHSSSSSDPSSCNGNNNGSNIVLNSVETAPDMYFSAISEPNTGISGPASSFANHFSDIGMEVESMSMRRNNQLSSVCDNVDNISSLQLARKHRPFNLLNASTSPGSCDSISGGSEPNSPTMYSTSSNDNSSGLSRILPPQLNGTAFPIFGPASAVDVPSNMSALLQSVRLHQYVTLFRDWNVSLLTFLHMSESDMQSIGIHDRQHLAQLLHEQSRIRSLVYAPSRQQVSRLLQQVQHLNSENRVLKSNFKHLLAQLESVYSQICRLDEQMVKLDLYTNELYAMF